MRSRFGENVSKPVTRADFWALAWGAAFAGALFAPLRHYAGSKDEITRIKTERDSFPLSTYPMFTAYRQGHQVIPHVVGFTATGERVLLHYRHFGPGGLNQVRKQIDRAVRRGHAKQVAQQYADSLAEKPRRRERDVVEVAVVRSRFKFDDYFGAGSESASTDPQAENVHARCPVGGAATAYEPDSLPRRPRS
jgi:hypothetical protein